MEEGLAPYDVSSVKRITLKKDGIEIATNAFQVTFDTPNLPKEVRIGYLQIKVQPYIPNPLRCFKCQKYGHHNSNCQSKSTCANCVSLDHIESDCTQSSKCIRCAGPHPVSSRDCHRWQQEKSIQHMRHTKGIKKNPQYANHQAEAELREETLEDIRVPTHLEIEHNRSGSDRGSAYIYSIPQDREKRPESCQTLPSPSDSISNEPPSQYDRDGPPVEEMEFQPVSDDDFESPQPNIVQIPPTRDRKKVNKK